ncbi:MAG: hypothetical protein AAF429_14925 [Pseudomonadota bacterium]
MLRTTILMIGLFGASFATAAPIATAESFGYSGKDALTYNRMVAGLASADCGKLGATINGAVNASSDNNGAIRQNAARAVARAKGC